MFRALVETLNDLRPQDGSPELFLAVSRLLRSFEKLEEARAVLRSGLKRFPESTALSSELGEMLIAAGALPEATDILEGAARRIAAHGVIFEALARIYKRRGAGELAISAYKVYAALEAFARNAGISPSGERQSEIPQPAGSDPIGTGSIEEPEELDTETMADLYLKQGDRFRAERIYRRLLEKNPSEARYRRKLQEIQQGNKAARQKENR